MDEWMQDEPAKEGDRRPVKDSPDVMVEMAKQVLIQVGNPRARLLLLCADGELAIAEEATRRLADENVRAVPKAWPDLAPTYSVAVSAEPYGAEYVYQGLLSRQRQETKRMLPPHMRCRRKGSDGRHR